MCMGGVSPLPFPIILGLKPAAPGPLAKKGGNDRHAPYLRGGGEGREGGRGGRAPTAAAAAAATPPPLPQGWGAAGAGLRLRVGGDLEWEVPREMRG